MEETSIEEGEIVDDEPHYTPLQRPKNYSAVVDDRPFGETINDSESEGELPSSSPSDSDSDTQVTKKKRPKVILKPKLRNNTRFKKYDIWSTKAQEDVLSQTLSSCDVTKKDRSRDVESYDYSLSYSVIRSNNKRTRDDRNNSTLRLVSKNGDAQSNPRNILDITISLDSSRQEIAKDIANKLCEEKDDLIQTIVEVVGQKKAVQVFQKVREIEAEGGMLIMNQTRRRTPGGIFFFLIKHDTELTAKQQDHIFGDQREQNKREQKLKKKMWREKMKSKIAAEKNNHKNLPELLTRAELCVQELVSSNDRSRKETEHEDVINPPPTPETDGQETSGDSMDPINGLINVNQDNLTRNIQEYEDDFLNINVECEMDLF